MESTLLHATRVAGVSSLPFLRFKPLLLSPQLNFPLVHRRSRLRFIATASTQHQHHHGHDHSCGHHHHELPNSASGLQGAVIRFAKATRWMDLANLLREHLRLCCLSAALFVGAAACPYLLPYTAIKPVQNVLFVIAFPLVGVSAALDAVIDISGGKVNIHVLMSLAAFASMFMGNPLEGAEEFFTSRSMVDVKELKENNPDSALVLNVNGNKLPDLSDLSYKSVPVHDVEIGSFILVGTGEAVPVDCEVFQGGATITIEHLTGEIKPIEAKVGDRVPGGARNVDGRIIVKATKTWKESTLSKIVQLTEEAHLNKPKLQRWLDEFGERYSKGILLRGAQVLDALASCHRIAFDKTGTLTMGGLIFKAIEPIYGHLAESKLTNITSCCTPNCEKEALAVASAMEKGTTHPIGRAVVDHSIGKELPSVCVESFEYFPGRGLIATLNNIESETGDRGLLKAKLGSVEFITSLCKTEDESRKIKEAVNASSYGSKFVHAALSVNEKVTLIHLEDRPRPGVADVILELRERAKLRVMMLTGDHESSAWRVAKAVGISEVYCSLKPEDKLNHVKGTSRGGGLIMVGEGINDAPALAAATVGIVLAQRASATAVAVADVLLLQDTVSGVPFCIAKSRQTTSLVKQNVALALTSIILASLPSVLGFLPLWLTVLLHEGGTLLVCLNSIRALNEPKWSWIEDFKHLANELKFRLRITNTDKTKSITMEAAPL